MRPCSSSLSVNQSNTTHEGGIPTEGWKAGPKWASRHGDHRPYSVLKTYDTKEMHRTLVGRTCQPPVKHVWLRDAQENTQAAGGLLPGTRLAGKCTHHHKHRIGSTPTVLQLLRMVATYRFRHTAYQSTKKLMPQPGPPLVDRERKKTTMLDEKTAVFAAHLRHT